MDVPQDEGDPVGRRGGVDRHERRPGLADAQQTHIRLHGLRQHQCHEPARPHPEPTQVVGHPIGPGVEVRVAQPVCTAFERDGRRCAVAGGLEEPVQPFRAARSPRSGTVTCRGDGQRGGSGGHGFPLIRCVKGARSSQGCAAPAERKLRGRRDRTARPCAPAARPARPTRREREVGRLAAEGSEVVLPVGPEGREPGVVLPGDRRLGTGHGVGDVAGSSPDSPPRSATCPLHRGKNGWPWS